MSIVYSLNFTPAGIFVTVRRELCNFFDKIIMLREIHSCN